jgi:hypothetical protein
MKQTLFQEKYPVFTLEVEKSKTSYDSVDAIIEYLKGKVEENSNTVFIAVFDHYSHTSSLPDGEIAPEIRDAKNLVFCFGIKLPTPQVMAVRPRSIGVTELEDKFMINFMEALMPIANTTMEAWVKGLLNK